MQDKKRINPGSVIKVYIVLDNEETGITIVEKEDDDNKETKSKIIGNFFK